MPGVSEDEAFDVTPYSRGADTLLPPPPAQLVAPAQVQDRLRRLFRGPRVHRDQRHRLARPGPHQRERPRRARVPRDGRGRHGDDVAIRPAARGLRSRRRHAERRRGHRARLPPDGRLSAQAQEPDEVPDQVDRVGSFPGGVRAWSMRSSAPKAARLLPFNPDAPPAEPPPDWSAPGASGRFRSRRARRAQRGPRPGHRPRGPTADGLRSGDGSRPGWRPTCGRRSRAATCSPPPRFRWAT